MKHPYVETAELLMALAHHEMRDKWADTEKIRKYRSEATQLRRLAKLDH
jgi:hypothetical protein